MAKAGSLRVNVKVDGIVTEMLDALVVGPGDSLVLRTPENWSSQRLVDFSQTVGEWADEVGCEVLMVQGDVEVAVVKRRIVEDMAEELSDARQI